jgi:hypothetical protein
MSQTLDSLCCKGKTKSFKRGKGLVVILKTEIEEGYDQMFMSTEAGLEEEERKKRFQVEGCCHNLVER